MWRRAAGGNPIKGHIQILLSFFFFFLLALGFEHRASHLLGRHLTT
jgi:hypothetical protein